MVGLLALVLAAPGTSARAADEERFFEPAALRADFADLYAGLQDAHFDLYARLPKAEYDALFAARLADLQRPMTELETQVFFQTFVAAGRVAHARIDYLLPAYARYRDSGGRGFPLGVRVSDGRIYVRENRSGDDRIARGDELTHVNGLPAETWLVRLGRHVSADTAYMSQSLIELDFDALLWVELGAIPEFEIMLSKPDGRALALTLPARSRAEMVAEPVPPQLSIDITERVAHMMPGGVAYLRPGIFMNLEEGADPYDASAFTAFVDRAFERFIAFDAQALILDLRDNPGGHNAFSDPMIAWFADEPFRFYSEFLIRASATAMGANALRVAEGGPSQELADLYAEASPGEVVRLQVPKVAPRRGRRFDGAVYVLVNRRSYSNAVAVAATVQDYGFGLVLGEPTSDLATTLGAMEQFTLARTGISVGYPKAHIVRPNGDRRPDGVIPDLLIPTPVVEGPDDPVLAQAWERVRAGAGHRRPSVRHSARRVPPAGHDAP